MIRPYVLTEAAEADLRGIIRYTRAQWGDNQVRVYVARLARGFERISLGDSGAKDMSALYPALRTLRCEHHYIFCLSRASEEEEGMLDLAAGARRTSRLACQIVLVEDLDGLAVTIPPEAHNMRRVFAHD